MNSAKILTNEDLLKKILEIRIFEELLSKSYSKSVIRCPVHLAIGHEASAIGICSHLNQEDIVFGYHRSHHHFLAKGGSAESLLLELLGTATGCSGGHGGSTHLRSQTNGFLGSTAIISGTIPVAVGYAHALKLKQKKHLVVCFSGDASTEEGIFFESLNIASLWNLPIAFVIEDNNLSCYTDKALRQSFIDYQKICDLFRINYLEFNGFDVHRIYSETTKIFQTLRETNRPVLFKINVHRAHEHCGPDEDNYLNYRDIDGLWPTLDPIFFLKKNMNSVIYNEIFDETNQKLILLFKKYNLI